MRRLLAATVFIVGGALSSVAVVGDTGAPSRQTFVLDCGGLTITVVSPIEPAAAAQVVGTTGVGVLLRVALSDGTVLFEQPSFQAHKASAITVCTSSFGTETLTLAVMMTPQGEHNP